MPGIRCAWENTKFFAISCLFLIFLQKYPPFAVLLRLFHSVSDLFCRNFPIFLSFTATFWEKVPGKQKVPGIPGSTFFFSPGCFPRLMSTLSYFSLSISIFICLVFVCLFWKWRIQYIRQKRLISCQNCPIVAIPESPASTSSLFRFPCQFLLLPPPFHRIFSRCTASYTRGGRSTHRQLNSKSGRAFPTVQMPAGVTHCECS